MTEKKSHHRKRKENRAVGNLLEKTINEDGQKRIYIGDVSDKRNVKNYLTGEFIHENHKHVIVDPMVMLKQLEEDRKAVAENQRLRNIARLEALFFSPRPLTKFEIIWQKIKNYWNKAIAWLANLR